MATTGCHLFTTKQIQEQLTKLKSMQSKFKIARDLIRCSQMINEAEDELKKRGVMP